MLAEREKGVSAEFHFIPKTDVGWGGKLLVEVGIRAVLLIASLEPCALQEPYAFKFL